VILISSNIIQIIEARETVGVIGLAGLVWSSVSAFEVLAKALNRPWVKKKEQSFFKTELKGLIIVCSLMFCLLVLFAGGALLQFLALFDWKLIDPIKKFIPAQWVSGLGTLLLVVAALLFLYRLVPNVSVLWRQAFGGALFCAITNVCATIGFGVYINSGYSTFNLVYGSLGTLIALMMWIYISIALVLWGAYLSSTIPANKLP